ncbi:G2/M phase-specific E3 ubiquitin-protein ligase-like isoform X2 [Haliotis rubra]|uniref:G2/M phase-specific E3 ubiquitin-protein ligase-like isoform X2 n=1 Tax=Haliotis rubra TaxID=36100 RepID=UPI001EE5971F|nr:G2/M phase-specific E3 ubiquitin-protein ligase-like isoform X2 [Haliotis rubra]
MIFVEKQVCPDCGGTFKDVSNHKICHSRGSGKHAHKPSVVLRQVCPDCGRDFVNLANHNVCRGRTDQQDTTPPTAPPVHSLTPPPTPPSSNTEGPTPAQQNEPDINAVPTGSQRLVREHLSRCMEFFGASRISVNRNNIWSSSMAFFKDVCVSKTAKQLMVTFTDSAGRLEVGVDTGGPRREYLRLLLESIVADSGVLRGDENQGFLIRPNISAYLKRHFRVIGVMLATIIAQGGQPPAIFAPPVVDAILDKDEMPSVDYVPDTRKRESLKKVSEARDTTELQEALDEFDWRFDLDGIPSYVTMASRDEFLRGCVQYFVILQSKPMLDQLIQGLRHCGILDLIRTHTLRDLLEYKSDVEVTAERVMDLLRPDEPCHSDEQQILDNLSRFLQAAEDGSLCDVLRESQRLTRSQTKFARRLTPGRLLAFVTGCSREPAGGFVPKPSIVFNRAAWRLPSAATCSNQILITVHQNSLEFHCFCQAMMTSMMNGENFTTA